MENRGIIFKNMTLAAHAAEVGVGSKDISSSQLASCISPDMHDGGLGRSRSWGKGGWERSDLRKDPKICSELTTRQWGARW